MQSPSRLPIRKRIRLHDFHYSGGCSYFVTICAYNHRHLFGEIADGTMFQSPIGQIVAEQWLQTIRLRPGVMVSPFEIMPNHTHAIVTLPERANATLTEPCFRRELFRVVGGFKSAVTSEVRTMLSNDHYKVWQPRSNDHVIRSEFEYEKISSYILNNVANWDFDRYNANRRT